MNKQSTQCSAAVGNWAKRLVQCAFLLLIAHSACVAGTVLPVEPLRGQSDNWITVRDKTGMCQMSVPPTWKLEAQLAGHVLTPEHTESMLISGFKRDRKPMSADMQKAVSVAKVFENTAERWFYVTKPIPGIAGQPTLVVYHVEVVRDGGTCIAQILVLQNHAEEEIKKIAESVAATVAASSHDKEAR